VQITDYLNVRNFVVYKIKNYKFIDSVTQK